MTLPEKNIVQSTDDRATWNSKVGRQLVDLKSALVNCENLFCGDFIFFASFKDNRETIFKHLLTHSS